MENWGEKFKDQFDKKPPNPVEDWEQKPED